MGIKMSIGNFCTFSEGLCCCHCGSVHLKMKTEQTTRYVCFTSVTIIPGSHYSRSCLQYFEDDDYPWEDLFGEYRSESNTSTDGADYESSWRLRLRVCSISMTISQLPCMLTVEHNVLLFASNGMQFCTIGKGPHSLTHRPTMTNDKVLQKKKCKNFLYSF